MHRRDELRSLNRRKKIGRAKIQNVVQQPSWTALYSYWQRQMHMLVFSDKTGMQSYRCETLKPPQVAPCSVWVVALLFLTLLNRGRQDPRTPRCPHPPSGNYRASWATAPSDIRRPPTPNMTPSHKPARIVFKTSVRTATGRFAVSSNPTKLVCHSARGRSSCCVCVLRLVTILPVSAS